MEKGAKIEIAVGILLIIAVMIGGFVWLEKKQKEQIQAAAQSSKVQTTPQPQPGEPVMADPEGGGTGSGQTNPSSDQGPESDIIESVGVSMPDGWTQKKIQNRMYIKDSNSKSQYNNSLVLSVKTTENDVTDINVLKSEGAGTDFTEIPGGWIFKVPGCGAVACYGAIIKDKIYSFNWDIETNDPNPGNARSGFNTDAIWNMMKTVTMG